MNLTDKEIGAAIIGCVVVTGAAIAGYLIHDGVSRETPSWQSISGGATLDARPVRTVIAVPSKDEIPPWRPLQPPLVQATPWPLGK